MNNPILSTLESRARSTPDSIAFLWTERGNKVYVTWRQHYSRIQSTAKYFRDNNISSGSIVLIRMASHYHWEIVEKAMMFLGASVYAVTDKRELSQQLDIVDRIAPDFIITDTPKNTATEYITPLSSRSQRASPEAQIQCVWDAKSGDIRFTYDNSSSPAMSCATEEFDWLRYTEHDWGCNFVTSGTTGEPKILRYSGTQVMLAIRGIAAAFFSDNSQDIEHHIPSAVTHRGVSWLPLESAYQRLFNYVALVTGAETYIVGNPKQIIDELSLAQPTYLIGVPSFYEQLKLQCISTSLLNENKAKDQNESMVMPTLSRRSDCSADTEAHFRNMRQCLDAISGGRLESMLVGSAPLTPETGTFFTILGINFFEGYGITQCLTLLTANRPGACRLGTVGKPFPSAQITLALDGEVLVDGGGVADSARNPIDGLLHTGDIGQFDDDGYLSLLGRKDDLIKTANGRRISLTRREQRVTDETMASRSIIFGHGLNRLLGLLSFDHSINEERETELLQALHRIAASLPPEQRVGGWLLLERELEIEKGEITPTLKIRRQTLMENFHRELDVLAATVRLANNVLVCRWHGTVQLSGGLQSEFGIKHSRFGNP